MAAHLRSTALPDGVTAADFGTAGTAALFDSQGVPVTGGQLTLASRGRTRTLLLDAATGAISAP